MMISLINEDHESICIDVTHVSHIDDVPRILKTIMMWMGFSMHTIDDVFDDELKELNSE